MRQQVKHKLLAILVCLCMAAALVACGGNATSSGANSTPASTLAGQDGGTTENDAAENEPPVDWSYSGEVTLGGFEEAFNTLAGDAVPALHFPAYEAGLEVAFSEDELQPVVDRSVIITSEEIVYFFSVEVNINEASDTEYPLEDRDAMLREVVQPSFAIGMQVLGVQEDLESMYSAEWTSFNDYGEMRYIEGDGYWIQQAVYYMLEEDYATIMLGPDGTPAVKSIGMSMGLWDANE